MSHGISLPEAAPSPPSRKKERTASFYFGGRVQLNVTYSVSVITTVSRGPEDGVLVSTLLVRTTLGRLGRPHHFNSMIDFDNC